MLIMKWLVYYWPICRANKAFFIIKTPHYILSFTQNVCYDENGVNIALLAKGLFSKNNFLINFLMTLVKCIILKNLKKMSISFWSWSSNFSSSHCRSSSFHGRSFCRSRTHVRGCSTGRSYCHCRGWTCSTCSHRSGGLPGIDHCQGIGLWYIKVFYESQSSQKFVVLPATTIFFLISPSRLFLASTELIYRYSSWYTQILKLISSGF